MRIKSKIIMILSFFILAGSIFGTELHTYRYEGLYHSAQRDLSKRKYDDALEKFLRYIKVTKEEKHKTSRLFWAIDHVARIYLRIQQDPEKAIVFFNSFEKDKRLSEEYFDIIEEWKTVSIEWKKNKKNKIITNNPNELFAEGLKQYRSGISKEGEKGDANLAISISHFSKLLFNHPEDNKIPRALLIMGDIKSRLRTDAEYWSENYYLKEVIVRVPKSNLSLNAWEKLNKDTRQGYTGSSGDNTPPEIIKMLTRYKKIATPNKKSSKNKK